SNYMCGRDSLVDMLTERGLLSYHDSGQPRERNSSPTRRSSDLGRTLKPRSASNRSRSLVNATFRRTASRMVPHPCARSARVGDRSEEHTSELQSLRHLVCRLLLEKKKHKSSY